jgi:hypothetical protein
MAPAPAWPASVAAGESGVASTATSEGIFMVPVSFAGRDASVASSPPGESLCAPVVPSVVAPASVGLGCEDAPPLELQPIDTVAAHARNRWTYVNGHLRQKKNLRAMFPSGQVPIESPGSHNFVGAPTAHATVSFPKSVARKFSIAE